ncbi:carbohydrate kinase family protein [Tumebacillus permanentifrigoris]|uniref:Sugar/nucleoside kinase (Ribokinase family) n=1 Tax=Tumebacillus permanentifrigoris TaxID=378543 RepID=A0A316DBG9_9BACL|nr:carbohydrate kinase family protein [Tumebacillus permanentifrigoris]PWK14945.1 sugar/nucleoside kinase (ribokinase family) [Tumebacillus permanentifrigoris]
MKKVLVLGGVSYNMMIDVEEFPEPVAQTVSAARFHETVGSTGAGKSWALQKLGVPVVLHGVIGADRYGQLIREHMEREGISFVYDVDGSGTERHVNFMKQATGERLSVFLHAPAEDVELDLERIEALIVESDVVFLNIAPYCKRLIPLLKKHRREIWCDLHSYDGKRAYYDEFIEHADVLLFSSEQFPGYREFMEKCGKKLVVCTHGAQGATAYAAGEWVEVPALKYEVVDTNGAGDNFFAGVLVGLMEGRTLQEAMRLGTVMGGLAVGSRELVDVGLSKEKVEAELREWDGGNHKCC